MLVNGVVETNPVGVRIGDEEDETEEQGEPEKKTNISSFTDLLNKLKTDKPVKKKIVDVPETKESGKRDSVFMRKHSSASSKFTLGDRVRMSGIGAFFGARF